MCYDHVESRLTLWIKGNVCVVVSEVRPGSMMCLDFAVAAGMVRSMWVGRSTSATKRPSSTGATQLWYLLALKSHSHMKSLPLERYGYVLSENPTGGYICRPLPTWLRCERQQMAERRAASGKPLTATICARNTLVAA